MRALTIVLMPSSWFGCSLGGGGGGGGGGGFRPVSSASTTYGVDPAKVPLWGE